MACKKYAVWGTGHYMGQIFQKLANSVKISCFIDSDSTKWGRQFTSQEIPCIAPAEIEKESINCVLVAVMDQKALEEITNYLEEHSFNYQLVENFLDALQMERINRSQAASHFEPLFPQGVLRRVVFVQIPTNACNMHCPYCYLVQNCENVFHNPLKRYPHKACFFAKALRYERLGGMAYFDLTSFGETLLYRDIVEVTKSLLEEGHVVSITTNGTVTEKIKELLGLPELQKKRLFIRFSFHYLELVRKKMVDQFFRNVRAVKESAASFTVMMVASDLYKPYKEEIKELFWKNLGALPQLDFVRESTRDDYSLLSDGDQRSYINFWKDFHSLKFEHRIRFFGRNIKEYCHAGDWCCYLNLFNGDLTVCSQLPAFTNIFEDISAPIDFQPYGENCVCPWCINSIIFANFGAIEIADPGPGYAEVFNRVDLEGNSWIKPELYKILNQNLADNWRKYGEQTYG